MRRFLVLAFVFLVWASPASAEPRVVIEASPTLGQAPLDVALVATGDAVAYHWDLGDGTQADGPIARHQYEAGRYTTTVTATGSDGSTARASVTITSLKLTLTGPRITTYGRRATFRGRLFPVIPGATISLYAGETAVGGARTSKSGKFSVHVRPAAPATYTSRFGSVVSNAEAVAVRPGLDIALPRTSMIGQPLALKVDLRPRGAGSLSVRVWRRGQALRQRTFGDRLRLQLNPSRAGDYVIQIAVAATGSFSARRTTVRTSVYLPYLSLGSRGLSVRILKRRLAELRYALRGVDGFYSFDTAEAVIAFQKVNGMSRTGRVDPGVWRRLRTAHVPQPRYQGEHHIEVDKSRQVLFEVGNGHVTRVVHVSTGATGNTPVGQWRVYSKVSGWSWVLWYPMYFLRGFAIHGYPSVPAYPASHGCVRTPMWIAPRLFAANSYGETIYVYY